MLVLALRFANKFREVHNYALMTSWRAPNQDAHYQAQSRCSKAPRGYLDIRTMTADVKD